jgi:alginate O-acetyltransferase complex protein AlgI
MTFNSPLFLFVFLPVFLLIYLISGKRLRNAWLLVASLVFYMWGEPLYFPVILLSILFNYFWARWIGQSLEKAPDEASAPQNDSLETRKARTLLVIAVIVNIGLLFLIKFTVTYWQPVFGLLNDRLGILLPSVVRVYFPRLIAFPLGMSFYTFAVVSYVIDVYMQRTEAERSLFHFALYILMFPKIIAGPIVRYRDVIAQIWQRVLTSDGLAEGARRFIAGLAKKVLVADTLGLVVDRGVFSYSPASLPAGVAWLAILCYALQIYFDFSGYTDMAIGIGQMLGFKFMENFNYPYISKSMTEFWRRWHISLSSWFRDYLFYPLERRGSTPQAFNILLVFLLTGLWHGLTLNFAVWGLLHGLAIALERGRFGVWLRARAAPVQHVYTLFVLLVGWVFFRSASLGYAWGFLKALAGFSHATGVLPYSVLPPIQFSTWLALFLAILFSMPVVPAFQRAMAKYTWWSTLPAQIARDTGSIVLFILSLVALASSTFQPYIYGNF